MRFLSTASLITAFGLCALYIAVSLPIVLNDAGHLGAGYFWAWLVVTLPITLRFWVLPFTFGQKAFSAIHAARFISIDPAEGEARADKSRIGAVFTMLVGFIVSSQLILHFIIEPVMNDYLDKAASGDVWGSIIWGAWLYALQQLTFLFVFPFGMAPFMVAAKSLANNAATALAHAFRGYITGGLPFMRWV